MAAETRLIVQRNEDDYAFEQDLGGRIVYLFDANVVKLFLNPGAETRHLLAFGRPQTSTDQLATTMITAEFMFSRRLSGQGGMPAYLSPGHGDDVAGLLRGIGKDMGRKLLEPLGDLSGDMQQVKDIVRQAKAGDLDDAVAVNELSKLVPGLAAALFDGPPYEARQFGRLVGHDMIRPLGLLPESTQKIMEPDQRLVKMWQRNLSDELRLNAGRERTTSGMDRDAQTLVQLLLLNDAAKDDNIPTKYVLVTTDRVMARAYSKWFYQGGNADPSDFALRHPFQYAPILNTQQMSLGKLRSELIQHLREVFDSLFPFAVQDHAQYMRVLAEIADPGTVRLESEEEAFIATFRADGSNRRDSVNAIEKVRLRWQDASRSAVLLNSSWLRAHYREGWDVAGELIRETESMEQGLLNHLGELMQDMESAHATFVAEGFMDLKGALKAAAARRPALLLRSDDPETKAIIESRTLAEMPPGLLQLPLSDWPSMDQDRLQLTRSACISFRSGQWTAAARYSRRALALLRLDERALNEPDASHELHELAYLESTALRRRVNEEGFRNARMLLTASLSYYADCNDFFGIARTQLEFGLLRISFYVYFMGLESRNPVSRRLNNIKHFFDAIDDVHDCLDTLKALPERADMLNARLAFEAHRFFVATSVIDELLTQTEAFDKDQILRSCDFLEISVQERQEELATSTELLVNYVRWTALPAHRQRLSAGQLASDLSGLDIATLDNFDRFLVGLIAGQLHRH